MRPAAALVALAAALAVVATSCGGSETPSASSEAVELADGLCSSVTTWADSLKEIGTELAHGATIEDDDVRSELKDAIAQSDSCSPYTSS